MLGLTGQEVTLVLGVLGKLGIGALLAGLIGWEREMHGRPAGVRTHMLLVLGVILFCEASQHFIGSETSRVAAQVVVGVGFLGAGTIMRTGPEIKGLTTAASLWATSGIGMAVSLGGPFLAIAILATVLALLTLVWVDWLEVRFLHTKKLRCLRLNVTEQRAAFDVLEEVTSTTGVQVRSVNILQSTPDVIMDVELRGETEGVLESALKKPGVTAASWNGYHH